MAVLITLDAVRWVLEIGVRECMRDNAGKGERGRATAQVSLGRTGSQVRDRSAVLLRINAS
jgi:hypothetical protein